LFLPSFNPSMGKMKKLAVVIVCVLSFAFAKECSPNRWKKVEGAGSHNPSFIGAHSMVEHLGNLYVFGGFFENFQAGTNTFYSKLWRYDSNHNIWTILDTHSGPTPRAFHTAASNALQGAMNVFGGITYNGDFSNITLYDDFWAWHYYTGGWTRIIPANVGPTARSNAGMTYLNGKVYLFGGIKDAFFTDVNDLWRYDAVTNTWTNLIPDGNTYGPSPRHSIQFEASEFLQKIYLYGGEITAEGFGISKETWVYDVVTNNWTNITPSDAHNIQPPRNFAGTTIIGDKFVLYGGDSSGGLDGCGAPFLQNPRNETWEFDTTPTRRTWTKLHPHRTPPRLKRHAAAHIGTCFYLQGGWNFPSCPPGQVWNNDLWVIEISPFDHDAPYVHPSSEGPATTVSTEPWGKGKHPLADLIAQNNKGN